MGHGARQVSRVHGTNLGRVETSITIGSILSQLAVRWQAGRMGTAASASVIEAPIDLVWSVMVDTDRYSEWNPFIVKIDRTVEGPLAQGEVLVLHVHWHTGGSARSIERVRTLDAPTDGRRALLEYTYIGVYGQLGLVRGHRIQELSRVDDDVTSYSTRSRGPRRSVGCRTGSTATPAPSRSGPRRCPAARR
jgi:hypothetical protein